VEESLTVSGNGLGHGTAHGIGRGADWIETQPSAIID
jgi:hypothetical protein